MVSEIFTRGGAFTEGDPTVLHHWERAGSWSEGFWSWTGISRWSWWRPFIRRTVPRSAVLHLGCEVLIVMAMQSLCQMCQMCQM